MLRERENLSLYQIIAAALAGAAAYIAWQLGRYGQRLRRQPPLLYRPTEIDASTLAEVREAGLAIAETDLRSGIEKRRLLNGEERWVVCAGVRNFREPWARDFSFASFGLMALGETAVVRDGLEVFLLHQRPSGQFPVKIHSTSILNRYLHSLFGREQPTDAPLRPKYVTAHNTISLDGNGLLAIAALHYARESGDAAFLDEYWPALRRGVGWMARHAKTSDGLLHQGAYTDWADSIARAGHVLYTNVLYWRALDLLAKTAVHHAPSAQEQLATRAEAVRRAIQDHFWRADLGYFTTSRRFDVLNSDGNLLAIAWGLAAPEQADRILDRMEQFQMATPVPTQVSHRVYPRRFIALENRLAGIRHYHTRAAWLWLGGWHVIALARHGRVAAAGHLLDRINQLLVRDGMVHEAYGRDGRPLSTRWYTAEAPLTWNAGMIIYAHHEWRRLQAGQKQREGQDEPE